MESEKVIFSYLKSRGYKTTEQSLKGEVKNATKLDLSQSGQLPLCEAAMDELFKSMHDANNDEVYIETFRTLLEWIDTILDTYKEDLQKIVSPIFLYLYLHMINRNMMESASIFYEEFSQYHSNKEELRELKGIEKPEDLDSDFVQNLFSHKYVILMNKYSIALLMSFIESSRLGLLLFIINQHLDLQVSNDSQSSVPVLLGDDVAILHDTSNLILLPTIEKDMKIFKDLRVPYPAVDTNLQEKVNYEISQKTDLNENNLPSIICHSNLNSNDSMLCMEISIDGTVIAAGFEDSSIRVWNLLRPVQVWKNLMANEDELREYVQLIGHSEAVFCLSFSPNTHLLISGSEDCSVRLWSLISNSCLVIYRHHPFPVWCVSFGPMGHYFASGSFDTTAALWSTDNIEPLKIYSGHLSDVIVVRFHPNIHYLATGSNDKTIRIWEVASGNCVRIFISHAAAVTSLIFSKSGKEIYSGDESGEVQKIDINEKNCISKIKLQGRISSLSLSQEGSLIACGSESNALTLADGDLNLVKNYPTKKIPMIAVNFTLRNLLVVGGPCLLEN